MTPEARAALEEERDFLLRSLEDLEREREAGDVDDADYRTLKDGYTSRAADVLRQLSAGDRSSDIDAVLGAGGGDASRAAPRRRGPAIVAWVAGIVAVAVLAGWLVARYSGERLPGQIASGNIESDSVSGFLADARAKLNPTDPGPAIEAYSQVLELEPGNVEALTYLGWLSVLSAFQSEDEEQGIQLYQTGLLLLRQATTIDETYADPHCFLGIAFSRGGDDEAAAPEFERCLELNPPSDTRQMVEAALERTQSATTDAPASTDAPSTTEP